MNDEKQTVTVDTGILELLSSKICHDLISPIGAINNGVEILDEMGAEGGDEVTGLIAYSAQQASAKLQAFRLAYGAGGADNTIKPDDVHKFFQAVVGPDNKIKQEWDPHGPLGYGDDRPYGFCKILMCALLLGVECLPKGGTLTVKSGEGRQTVILAEGTDAQVKGQSARALAGEMHRDILEPKYIHALMTGLMARTYNYKITMETHQSGIALIVALP